MIRIPIFILSILIASVLSIEVCRAAHEKERLSSTIIANDVLSFIADWFIANTGLTVKLGANAKASLEGNTTEMYFPDVSLVQDIKRIVKIGDISANATHKNDNEYKFLINVPNSISFFDEQDMQIGEVDWRTSKIRGTWNSKLETSPVFDISLKDVQAHNKDMTKLVSIDSIDFNQNLTEDFEDLWSGPSSLRLDNLSMNGKDESILIDSFSYNSYIRGLNLYALKGRRDAATQLSADKLAEEAQSALFRGGEGFGAEIVSGLLNSDAMQIELSLSGLELNHEESGRLEEFMIRFDYDHSKKPDSYSLILKLDGLNYLDQIDSSIPPYFKPKFGNIALSINNFPLKSLTSGSIAYLGNTPVDLNEILLELIYEKSSEIAIEELFVQFKDASVNAKSTITAAQESPFGFSGNATVEITGLDKLLIDTTRFSIKDEDSAGLVALLTLAKGLGKPKINASGDIAYMFNIVLPPNGDLTINEVPLGLLSQ